MGGQHGGETRFQVAPMVLEFWIRLFAAFIEVRQKKISCSHRLEAIQQGVSGTKCWVATVYIPGLLMEATCARPRSTCSSSTLWTSLWSLRCQQEIMFCSGDGIAKWPRRSGFLAPMSRSLRGTQLLRKMELSFELFMHQLDLTFYSMHTPRCVEPFFCLPYGSHLVAPFQLLLHFEQQSFP